MDCQAKDKKAPGLFAGNFVYLNGKERLETVERQALYCKAHLKECQQQLTPFVNSQIENANEFYKRLAKTKNGTEKIRQIKRV